MNGSRASVAELTQGVVAGAADIDGAEILLCPPALFLSQVLTGIEGSPVELGAQDLYMEAGGAYTGEISGPMLKDAECTYVIVGHSERRALMGYLLVLYCIYRGMVYLSNNSMDQNTMPLYMQYNTSK